MSVRFAKTFIHLTEIWYYIAFVIRFAWHFSFLFIFLIVFFSFQSLTMHKVYHGTQFDFNHNRSNAFSLMSILWWTTISFVSFCNENFSFCKWGSLEKYISHNKRRKVKQKRWKNHCRFKFKHFVMWFHSIILWFLLIEVKFILKYLFSNYHDYDYYIN